MAKEKWEKVCDEGISVTERMRVPGGWLICRTWGSGLSARTMTMVFVPDTNGSYEYTGDIK